MRSRARNASRACGWVASFALPAFVFSAPQCRGEPGGQQWQPPHNCPLALLTPQARTIPPSDSKLIDEWVATVQDQNQPYIQRADAARKLAGLTSTKAVKALCEGLLEGGPFQHVVPFRIDCAQSLKWAAAKSNKSAVDALYQVLTDVKTNDVRSGAAIVKVLLEARGGSEVLTEIGRCLRNERTRIKPATGEMRKRWLRTIWSWFLNTMASCHFEKGLTARDAFQKEISLTVAKLREMADPALLMLLEREGELLAEWSWSARLRDQIPPAVVIGLSKRAENVRQAAARWLVENASPARPYSSFLWIRLNRDCLLEINKVAKSLRDTDAVDVQELIRRICRNRQDEVLSGQVQLADVVEDDIRKTIESSTGPFSDELLEKLSAGLGQLAFLAPSGREEHPFLRILSKEGGYPKQVRIYAGVGVEEAPFPGMAADTTLTKKTAATLLGQLIDEISPTSLQEGTFYLFLSSARARLVEQDRGRLLLADYARLKARPDLWEATAHFLCEGSTFAYATELNDMPIRIAEQAVELFEAALKRETADVRGRNRTFSLLEATIKNLTPEELPSEIQGHLYMQGLPAETDPDKIKAWNDNALAAWKAWLARFRALPAFAKPLETPR